MALPAVVWVTASAQVPSLAQEIPHAQGVAKKKKMQKPGELLLSLTLYLKHVMTREPHQFISFLNDSQIKIDIF